MQGSTPSFDLSKEWIEGVFSHARQFHCKIEVPRLAFDSDVARLIAPALILPLNYNSDNFEFERSIFAVPVTNLERGLVSSAAGYCKVHGGYRPNNVNVVYSGIIYRPPHFVRVPRLMNILFKEFNSGHIAPSDCCGNLGLLAAFYCVFLSIHPLRNGNGRVARILYYFLTGNIEGISIWALLGIFLLHRQKSAAFRVALWQVQKKAFDFDFLLADLFRCINSSVRIFENEVLQLNEAMRGRRNDIVIHELGRRLVEQALSSARY